MKIEKAKQLTARKFKRMTGVNRKTFELMVGLVKADAQKKKKPSRRPKIIIEDQVLMVLQYWSGAGDAPPPENTALITILD